MKRKGTFWENQLVDLLEENIPGSTAKRVAGSGAIGTILNEPLLTGDLVVNFPGFSRKFRGEAKAGYGGSTQTIVKKAWLDKIKEEAENTYSIPFLGSKFSNVKSGVKYFITLDFETFCSIINYVNDLKKELDMLYEEISE